MRPQHHSHHTQTQHPTPFPVQQQTNNNNNNNINNNINKNNNNNNSNENTTTTTSPFPRQAYQCVQLLQKTDAAAKAPDLLLNATNRVLAASLTMLMQTASYVESTTHDAPHLEDVQLVIIARRKELSVRDATGDPSQIVLWNSAMTSNATATVSTAAVTPNMALPLMVSKNTEKTVTLSNNTNINKNNNNNNKNNNSNRGSNIISLTPSNSTLKRSSVQLPPSITNHMLNNTSTPNMTITTPSMSTIAHRPPTASFEVEDAIVDLPTDPLITDVPRIPFSGKSFTVPPDIALSCMNILLQGSGFITHRTHVETIAFAKLSSRLLAEPIRRIFKRTFGSAAATEITNQSDETTQHADDAMQQQQKQQQQQMTINSTTQTTQQQQQQQPYQTPTTQTQSSNTPQSQIRIKPPDLPQQQQQQQQQQSITQPSQQNTLINSTLAAAPSSYSGRRSNSNSYRDLLPDFFREGVRVVLPILEVRGPSKLMKLFEREFILNVSKPDRMRKDHSYAMLCVMLANQGYDSICGRTLRDYAREGLGPLGCQRRSEFSKASMSKCGGPTQCRVRSRALCRLFVTVGDTSIVVASGRINALQRDIAGDIIPEGFVLTVVASVNRTAVQAARDALQQHQREFGTEERDTYLTGPSIALTEGIQKSNINTALLLDTISKADNRGDIEWPLSCVSRVTLVSDMITREEIATAILVDDRVILDAKDDQTQQPSCPQLQTQTQTPPSPLAPPPPPPLPSLSVPSHQQAQAQQQKNVQNALSRKRTRVDDGDVDISAPPGATTTTTTTTNADPGDEDVNNLVVVCDVRVSQRAIDESLPYRYRECYSLRQLKLLRWAHFNNAEPPRLLKETQGPAVNALLWHRGYIVNNTTDRFIETTTAPV